MKKKELKKINKKLTLALNLLTAKVDDLIADLETAKRRANDAEREIAQMAENDNLKPLADEIERQNQLIAIERAKIAQYLGEGEG